MLNRLFIAPKCSTENIGAECSELIIAPKMFWKKKIYWRKQCSGQTDRLFITGKTKRFRDDYLSKQNIPDYLSHEKTFRTGCVSEQQILRMEGYTQNSYRLISREACHWLSTGQQTKDSARATVTRTFLTCCHPKNFPEQ